MAAPAGFKAHISRYIGDKLTVVVFANHSRANQAKPRHGVAASLIGTGAGGLIE